MKVVVVAVVVDRENSQQSFDNKQNYNWKFRNLDDHEILVEG